MKTVNVSLRNMSLAMLLLGVTGAAWAVGPVPPMSPAAALTAAAGVAPASAADAAAVSPVTPVAASADDDRAETTLKKASALQAKYALRKIQSDIDKLDASPSSGGGGASPFPTTNPLDALRAANGASPALPTPLAQHVETKPAVAAAPASTMKAIGTYGVGDSAYADMLIDDGRIVATRGMVLSNGYRVEAVTPAGVNLSKGRQHLTLPVVPGPIQAMATGGSMGPGMTNGSPMGSVPEMSRFNQLTGPSVVNSIPPGLNQPMIIPTQPVGPTAGGFSH